MGYNRCAPRRHGGFSRSCRGSYLSCNQEKCKRCSRGKQEDVGVDRVGDIGGERLEHVVGAGVRDVVGVSVMMRIAKANDTREVNKQQVVNLEAMRRLINKQHAVRTLSARGLLEMLSRLA